MSQWANRDASAYYAIYIHDKADIRYCVHAMIEGIAIALLPEGIQLNTRIIEEFYRHEMTILLDDGKLRQDGPVNVVFFAEEDTQICEGDTVVWNAASRLLDAVRRTPAP
ncbi:MAG: hypothetical protein R3B48_13070 [Kofleriaceae bacterium]